MILEVLKFEVCLNLIDFKSRIICRSRAKRNLFGKTFSMLSFDVWLYFYCHYLGSDLNFFIIVTIVMVF